MHTYKVNNCRKLTFRLRIPPPTGVVSGPLIAMRNRLIAARVSSGSHVLRVLNAFSPASTSYHTTRRAPP
jgi:hypothetical protein